MSEINLDNIIEKLDVVILFAGALQTSKWVITIYYNII